MVNLNGKRILVTGGGGFIGSNFIKYVFANYTGVALYNVDKMGIGSRFLFNTPKDAYSLYRHIGENNYYFRNRDLADVNNVLPLTYVKFDYIFHFAAESHVDRSINSPTSFIENNVMGTANLLENVRKYNPTARVVCCSTDEVYGHLGLNDPPFTEDSPLAPRSPYAASKAASDLVALSYHSTYGLDVLVTRCCNNYGPHQHGEKFIPTVISSIHQQISIPVYGNGQNIREWIYVDDHNKSILEIADIGESGNVYNIGSGVEKSNLDLIRDILDITVGNGKNLEDYVEFVEDRKGHDFRYAIESLKYERGFELENYYTGLKKTIQHYQQEYNS